MNLRSLILSSALLCMATAFWGCDWSGGGDGGFNTSRAGLDVNISGVYKGTLSGGKAVSNTSGAPISNFVFQQSGNVIEVTDSNGQMYRGNVGAPGAVFTGTGTIPSGALLASYQISFSGKDGVAAKDIEFTGIIHAVAIIDIEGDETVQISGDSTNTTRTITKTFELTEANAQFRLAGTWIEQAGSVSEVEARSSASGRLVGTTTEGVAGSTN